MTEELFSKRAGGRSVLVGEDNDDVSDFACSMLRELGHTTRRAASGAQALEILASPDERFDAVFSDVVMPGMSGLELAATVRARHPQVAVLLASGYSETLGARDGERPAPVFDKRDQLLELGVALDRCLAGVEVS